MADDPDLPKAINMTGDGPFPSLRRVQLLLLGLLLFNIVVVVVVVLLDETSSSTRSI